MDRSQTTKHVGSRRSMHLLVLEQCIKTKKSVWPEEDRFKLTLFGLDAGTASSPPLLAWRKGNDVVFSFDMMVLAEGRINFPLLLDLGLGFVCVRA